MAIVDINYACGCGFHARTVEEAIKHVDDSQHTLSVLGSVKSSVPKVRVAAAYSHSDMHADPRDSRPPARKLASAATPAEVRAEVMTNFGDLRNRMRR
ncbi:hypothetical protein MUP59_06845 [Candidatus Bathyarchaeota archaeon]|nr:hypothetical protein [Candidatus Bathyarchaeota archaeon]